MFGKIAFLKVSESSWKCILSRVAFKQLEFFIVTIFKITVIVLVVESLFMEVAREITAFCKTVENLVTCIGIFVRISLL